jgi:hypothetical protein
LYLPSNIKFSLRKILIFPMSNMSAKLIEDAIFDTALVNRKFKLPVDNKSKLSPHTKGSLLYNVVDNVLYYSDGVRWIPVISGLGNNLIAGFGISIVANGNNITISNTSPATSVTLSSLGGTFPLVPFPETGPALGIMGLNAGTGITLTTDAATEVTINLSPNTLTTVILTSGISTIIPATARSAFVMASGGGGGGGSSGLGPGGGGGGGGASGYVAGPYAITPGATLTYAIGGAGLAAAGSSGGAGGATTIQSASMMNGNTVIAFGGAGGIIGGSGGAGTGGAGGDNPLVAGLGSFPSGAGGVGGNASGGTSGGNGATSITFAGGAGGVGSGAEGGGGGGGASTFSSGGAGGAADTAGSAPPASTGAGGGGGGGSTISTFVSGGGGSAGWVQIWYYS